MGEPTKRSEAEVVAELTTRAVEPKLITVQRGDESMSQVLLAPAGMNAYSVKKFVDEHLAHPERRKGTSHHQELGSFIAHANRFKAPESAVFAEPSPSAPKLTSVLDYHLAGEDADRIKARHGEHRGVYHFPLAEEWKTWRAVDGKGMGQAAFAEFLESNILDVIDPGEAGANAKLFAMNTGCEFAAPSKLMALSRGLALHVESRVKEAVNLGTGEVQIAYEESHKDTAGSKLAVPGAFLVCIPVFRSGFAYQIPIRLRYRVKDGSVTWFLAMFRPDRFFDDAFMGAVDRVKTETELPVFVGTPES